MAALAESLGESFDELGHKLIPSLLELSGRGKKVMADYGSTAVHAIVTHCHGESTLAAVLKATVATIPRRPSPPVMLCCAKFIRVALETWPVQTLDDLIPQISTAMVRFLNGKAAEARADGRRAFLAFSNHWPAEGDALLTS